MSNDRQAETYEWIDTHCHLTDSKIPGGLDLALEMALAVGVWRVITIGTCLETSTAAVELSKQNHMVWATIGVHPHDAKLGINGLENLLTNKKVAAIGECGLDYFYEHSDRKTQREIFAAQIDLANAYKLPLVIHTRDAWDETFEILDSCGVPSKTIFHCFTGSPIEAKKCAERDAYISFSGILTFKNSIDIRTAACLYDGSRILIETDSPWLAPVPHRGQLNHPALVVEVGKCLSEIRHTTVKEIASLTTTNALAAFPKLARDFASLD